MTPDHRAQLILELNCIKGHINPIGPELRSVLRAEAEKSPTPDGYYAWCLVASTTVCFHDDLSRQRGE
jgi:hypothetical protein